MKRCAILVSCVAVVIAANVALAQEGEIPITTASAEAGVLFKQGRDLSERLRTAEAATYFEQAVAKDPTFALAYLSLANAQTSPKGFFDNLRKAVALIDRVSEGERLTILAAQAFADNNVIKQREYLDKLVQGYPKDQRAHVLLSNFLYGQQEYASAIAELKKAIDLAPYFSPAYNLLGYAYSRAENYTEAEKAFKRYTELIPNESNPHDSYAELLMKRGKFEESMKEYGKSLALNPKFYGSYLGWGMNLVLTGKHREATKIYKRLYDIAPDDGTRQQALFAAVIAYVDEAKFARAVAEQDRNYQISRNNNDIGAMAADLGTLGDILIEVGPIDQAKARFEKAGEVVSRSDIPPAVREFGKQVRLSGLVRVALHAKDISAAKAAAAELKRAAEQSKNSASMQAYYQHAGMIALEEKRYTDALGELQKSDQRSPRTLFLLGQTYAANGDKDKARHCLSKAATFNEINIEFAFIREKAKQLLSRM